MIVRSNFSWNTAKMPMVMKTSCKSASTPPTANCHSKRSQIYSMIPMLVIATARIDDQTSSPDTFGPTDSMELKVIAGSTTTSASSTCWITSGVTDWVLSSAAMRIIATC